MRKERVKKFRRRNAYMDIIGMVTPYLNVDYAYILAILLASYLAGRIIAPFLVWIGVKFTEKAKNHLGNMILREIQGPVETFFFLVLVELSMAYMPAYFMVFQHEQLENIMNVALVIFLTYLAYKTVHVIFWWYYSEGRNKSKLNVPVDLLPFLKKLVQVCLIVIGMAIVLDELGIDITAFAFLPLIITLVASLAAQDILSNVFYGMAMQMERQVKYGDYIRLPSGDVVRLRKIGLRTTKLTDLCENMMFVSNAEFAKLRITKLEEDGGSAMVSVPFEIGADCDLAKLLAHVKKALAGRDDIVKDQGCTSITVSKYKQGWVEGSVNLMALNLMKSADANDAVTRAIKEFASRKA
jgi:MscS family membrane protein